MSRSCPRECLPRQLAPLWPSRSEPPCRLGNRGEIKNIEQVFQFIAKHVKQNEDKPKDESDGALSYVYRRVAAPPKPGAQGDDDQDTQRDEGELVRVVALTAGQLRKYLPEFNLNVFFDRLVRVFSESGEQMLTLVELIDLYSALSHRASVKWKARVCFCVFDFDEDNKLGRRDIVRSSAACRLHFAECFLTYPLPADPDGWPHGAGHAHVVLTLAEAGGGGIEHPAAVPRVSSEASGPREGEEEEEEEEGQRCGREDGHQGSARRAERRQRDHEAGQVRSSAACRLHFAECFLTYPLLAVMRSRWWRNARSTMCRRT